MSLDIALTFVTQRGVSTQFNICVVRPEGYPHSRAFDELAELLHYALEDLGFLVRVEINRIDPRGRNIVIGGHLFGAAAISRLPDSTIILNTEQLGAAEHTWTDSIVAMARRFETWDYTPANISFLERCKVAEAKFLPIGFHPRLSRIEPADEADVDVLFYGSMSDRRRQVLERLAARGAKIKTLFGVYGVERDRWISRSKLVLNCHHYDTHIFEVVRVFYLLANRVAVVGEVGTKTQIEDDFRHAVAAVPYEALVETCLGLLADNQARKRLAARGHALIRERSQSELLKPLLTC